MSTTSLVKANIKKAYERKKVKLYALSLSYSGQAINRARAEKTWTDRTSQAVERMFSRAFIDGDEIGFLLAHHVPYGIPLELANDRKYEIIRPIIADLAPKFLADAKKIY